MKKGFLEALWHTPELSRLSRYTMYNGMVYMGLGAAMLTLPIDWLGIPMMQESWVGREEGYFRMMGLCLGVVGWFYYMGGRTGAESFGLSTVVDRALVPFVLGGLWAAGKVTLPMVVGIGVLDPVLAFGAWWIWSSEEAGEPSTEA